MKKNIDIKKILIWSLGVILVGLTVYVTIESSTSGAELSNMEKIEAKLTQENDDLSNELVGNSSLNTLESKASELGFAKPTKILYIGEEQKVAKLP